MHSEIRNIRLVLLGLLAVSAAGAALAEEPADFAAALARATAEDKVLVVDFYTDW